MARILLVDDCSLILECLSEAVRRGGHDCDTAADGLEGLARIEAVAYDAVLTNYRMPRMDGLELINRSLEGSGARVPHLLFSASRFIAEYAASTTRRWWFLGTPCALDDWRARLDAMLLVRQA